MAKFGKKTKTKKKASKLAWLVRILAVIALILVIVLIVRQCTQSKGPGPGPSTPTTPGAHRPDAQSADCPDVLVMSVPGTWESKANDNPYNPTANPKSLMLQITSQLQNDFPASRAQIHTVPYKAQFRNPTNLADKQASYDDSRSQGYARTYGKLDKMQSTCPLTTYVLMGFSQGAVIVGDIASRIGQGDGPITADNNDLVLGVGLIADGRRESGKQNDVGPSPEGVGAEVVLGGMVPSALGITMTGKRAGFGTLQDRTYSVCADGDLICDSPRFTNPISAIGEFAFAAQHPVHAMYATTQYWNYDGQTATDWMYSWAKNLIDNAPHPKHL